MSRKREAMSGVTARLLRCAMGLGVIVVLVGCSSAPPHATPLKPVKSFPPDAKMQAANWRLSSSSAAMVIPAPPPDRRTSVLLDFNSETDLAFVEASSRAAGLDARVARGSAGSSLLLPPGAHSVTINL